MLKAELRKIYLEKRKNLSPEEIKQKSREIADRFFQTFDLTSINFLHVFLSIERLNEIDTNLIIEKIRREYPHIKLVVPRVNRQTNELENLAFKPETELIESAWQIYEPAGNDTLETEKIDLVLVPLLCFDREGHRVGYGKGFYDRLLKKCRADCLKIGLSYFSPVEIIFDTHIFDVQLDFCIMPGDILEF